MNTLPVSNRLFAKTPSPPQHASVNTWLLAIVALVLAGAIIVVLKQKPTSRQSAPPAETPFTAPGELAAVTQSVARETPPGVEIRFYTLLDVVPGTEMLRAYSDRIATVVTQVAQASAGRLSVTMITHTQTDAQRTALADGLEPVRAGREPLNFLGVAVHGPGGKAVLARLDPAWEAAFQFDLARAIARASGHTAGSVVTANPAPVDSELTAEVRRVLPDLDSLTLEEAKQKLRATALEDFKVAVRELQQQLQAAQEKIAMTDTVAARRELQELQLALAEKLNEIPRRTQAQIEALERIKQ